MRKAIRELQMKAKLKIKEKLHQIVKQPTTNYKNSVGKRRERLYFVQREDLVQYMICHPCSSCSAPQKDGRKKKCQVIEEVETEMV